MNLTWGQRAALAMQVIKGSLDVREGSLASSLLKGIWPSISGEPPKRQGKQFLDTYNQMPWARAPVGRIANSVAALNWRLFYRQGKEKDEMGRQRIVRDRKLQRMDSAHRKSAILQGVNQGDLKEVEDHILLDALSNGNVMLSGQACWKVSSIHMDSVGETFWMKERNGAGAPIAFWPIPNYWVIDTPSPTHRFYRVSFRAWQGLIPDSEIVWFKDPDPVHPYGRGSGTSQTLADEYESDEYACHDATTECLTKRGWVLWPDVTMEDELATWSEEKGCLEYQRPSEVHQYDYDGTLQHWSGRSIDAMVTPNHRMWMHGKVYKRPAHPAPFWHFETSAHASERLWAVQRFWRDAARYEGKQATVYIEPVERITKRKPGSRGGGRPPAFGVNDPLVFKARDVARWIGYVVSEGSVDAAGIGVCQKEGRFADDIRTALSVFPEAWRREKTAKGPFGFYTKWNVLHLGLAEWVRKHIGCGAENKRLPAEVFEWEHDAQHELFMGLMNGDGCWNKNGRSVGYATISKQLADDVQRLAVLLGYSSLLRGGDGRGYFVNIRLKNDRRQVFGGGTTVNDVPYIGKVYCATVPNGLLVTRRNGSVLVSGNSKHIKQFFFNRAKPDFMVYPKGEMNNMGEDQVKALERRWLDNQQGFWRAFRPQFMSREVGIHEFTQNFQHLQMTELRSHSRDTALQTYGIPPEILGVIENSNRSTIDGAFYAFQKLVIEPRAEFWRSELQQKVIPDYDPRLIIDYDSPVQEDREFTLKAYQAKPSTITVDEWRCLQGLPPVGGKEGELRFQQINETLESGFEETEDVEEDYAPDGQPQDMKPPKEDEEVEDDEEKKIAAFLNVASPARLKRIYEIARGL